MSLATTWSLLTQPWYVKRPDERVRGLDAPEARAQAGDTGIIGMTRIPGTTITICRGFGM